MDEAPTLDVIDEAFEGFEPALARPYARNAFNLSGKIDEDLRLEGRLFVQDMLARGASRDEIMRGLAGLFTKWIDGGRAGEIPQGNVIPLRAAPRIENIARTEFSRAYNTARVSLMTDPAVSAERGGVVIGFGCSTVFDSRTTEICEMWGGNPQKGEKPVAFRNDAEGRQALARYGSPRHHQCRGTELPITIYDDPSEWVWYPDIGRQIVQPAPGFGGRRAA